MHLPCPATEQNEQEQRLRAGRGFRQGAQQKIASDRALQKSLWAERLVFGTGLAV